MGVIKRPCVNNNQTKKKDNDISNTGKKEECRDHNNLIEKLSLSSTISVVFPGHHNVAIEVSLLLVEI